MECPASFCDRVFEFWRIRLRLPPLHEGFPYAAEISKNGYNVFVLKYRAGIGGATRRRGSGHCSFLYVFRNAKPLGVAVADYSLWGSSAGARMAASIEAHEAAFLWQRRSSTESVGRGDGLARHTLKFRPTSLQRSSWWASKTVSRPRT